VGCAEQSSDHLGSVRGRGGEKLLELLNDYQFLKKDFQKRLIV
jgi:hypothetical protein